MDAISLEERKREIELIKTRNLMEKAPRLDKQELIYMGCPEWTINIILEERGEKVSQNERLEIQSDAVIRNKVLELMAMKPPRRSEATELVVKRILELNHIFTTRDDSQEEVWIYDRGIYVPNGKSFIMEEVRLILGQAFSMWFFKEVLVKIQADTMIDQKEFFKMRHKEEIAVQNGILNIITKELSSFSPDKIFFNKLPVFYDENIRCYVIEEFLKDILSNEEDIKVYYELGGFALLKEYRYEKAFMFVGNGRNGKGRALELIKRVIGAENCYSLPLSAISSENADVSGLFNKMVNLAGDISNTDLKETGLFKSLTGRDLVTAKRKYLTAITFENYAKFIFACNDLPMVYDLSKGFWDRWILLEFPYYFGTKQEMEQADEDKKKYIKERDESIIDKITTPEQLSGLLNEFIKGLERLIKNKTFSSTKGSEEIKTTWIRRSNSFIAFCMDFLEEDYESKISKKDLRRVYSKYCQKHKVIGKSDKVIQRVLQENYGADEERLSVLGGNLERFWVGIKWKGGELPGFP